MRYFAIKAWGETQVQYAIIMPSAQALGIFMHVFVTTGFKRDRMETLNEEQTQTGQVLEAQAEGSVHETQGGEPEVVDRIMTAPNVISFIRLFTIPVFYLLLMCGYSVPAGIIFGLSAATDAVDGHLARATHSVSKLGKILDPAVDRMLMVTGVFGVFIVGRLPLWIIIVVVARDLLLLVGGAYILDRYKVRVDVLFLGKVVTTLLFIGFFGLMVNWPLVEGLGIVPFAWLPGLCAGPAPIGIWCVYVGLALGIITTTYYIVTAVRRTLAAMAEENKGGQ